MSDQKAESWAGICNGGQSHSSKTAQIMSTSELIGLTNPCSITPVNVQHSLAVSAEPIQGVNSSKLVYSIYLHDKSHIIIIQK